MTRTRVAVFIAALACAAALASCGGPDADALGHQACRDVTTSIKLYNKAQHDPTAAVAKHDAARALKNLQAALRPAAFAAAASGDWQALNTQLSETSRGVPEGQLIQGLTAQCASSRSS